MTPSTQYRRLAAELRAKAQQEESPAVRAEGNHLAQCYVRLAEQADKNQRTDIVYEPTLRSERRDDDTVSPSVMSHPVISGGMAAIALKRTLRLVIVWPDCAPFLHTLPVVTCYDFVSRQAMQPHAKTPVH